jgi:protease-4
MNRIATNVFNQHYFISADGAAAYLPLVISMLKGNFPKADFSENRKSNNVYFLNSATFQLSEYGEAPSPEKAPQNSVAVLPVFEVITKSDQSCGPSGTDTKKKILERCGANPNITGVVLHISSPGGEAFASLDMYKAIVDFKSQYNKSVIAYVDDIGCSGAMYIAAACDKIICSDELTQVGSIGVVSHIFDEIKTLEKEGIFVHEIYADESSEKNIEFREAVKGNYKPLKERASVLVNRFIDDVKAMRPGITNTETDPFKGKTLFAKEAIKIGLIDEIGTMQLAVKHINSINSNTNQQTNSSMKIPFKSTWAAIALLFATKKEGDELTEADVDQMNSELGNRQTSIDNLTAKLNDAGTVKTNAEAAQKKVEDELKVANNLVKTTQESLVAAESQLTNATTALDAIDDSVKTAATVTDKVAAVNILLAAKPGAKPSGVNSSEDKNATKDNVDWETINALPHMQ